METTPDLVSDHLFPGWARMWYEIRQRHLQNDRARAPSSCCCPPNILSSNGGDGKGVDVDFHSLYSTKDCSLFECSGGSWIPLKEQRRHIVKVYTNNVDRIVIFGSFGQVGALYHCRRSIPPPSPSHSLPTLSNRVQFEIRYVNLYG